MPPKQGDKQALTALRAALKTGGLGRLYLFHGEESYLREFYLKEIQKTLLPGGLEDFNLRTFQGKGLTVSALSDAVDCLPMMSERTLVVVHDFDLFQSDEVRDGLAALFSDLPDYCCLIFSFERLPYKPDGRTKLAGLIREHGIVIDFARQEQGSLVPWIQRRFSAEGREIDSEQCRYLLFLCGDFMQNLTGEIAKVAAYTKGPRVTRADIDAVAIPQLSAEVFEMTRAMTAREYDKALRLLSELLDKQESPIMILAVLGSTLRQLYAARLVFESGGRPAMLVERWRMHPYPAEKLFTAARQLSLPWCRRAVIRAFEVDLAMKSGSADDEELLVSFVLELVSQPTGCPS